MGERIKRGSPWRALPGLALVALLLLPVATTRGKYVWEESVSLTLSVKGPASGCSNGLLVSAPSVSWDLQLEGVTGEASGLGLKLTADEGYALPESVTVSVGGVSYVVRTDGADAPEGVSFDEGSGTLVVDETLVEQGGGVVTVWAAALPDASSSGDGEGASAPDAANGDDGGGSPASGDVE